MLWIVRLVVIAVLTRIADADILMDALSAFVDVNSIAGDAKTILELAEEMKKNTTISRFDNTFPLSPQELGLLFLLYDKCATSESLALLTWCTGVPPNGTSLDGEQLCPRGVRTHPCTGRVLDVSKDVDSVQYLWPWQGIKCDAFTDPTTVTNIYLPGQGLKCRLQDLDFSYMASLEQLDLSQNEIFGPFPSWLGNMTMLRFLNLSGNHIASNLPLSFGDNIAIEVIDLAQNRLTAPSLSFFKIFKRLRHLNLAHNKFNLTLPSGFFSGEYLEHLNLSHNFFHGALPRLPTLKHLVSFDVSHNNFEVELPQALGTWGRTDPEDPAEDPVTEILDFSYNQFNGSIPPLLNQSSLLRFAVQFNNLSGIMPKLPISLFSSRMPRNLEGNGFLCPLPQLTPSPGDYGNLTCVCKSGQLHGNAHEPVFSRVPAAQATAECETCPRGSYSNATTKSLCLPCPVGHITNRTSAISDRAEVTECAACSPGTFANATGSEECSKCPPGTIAKTSGQAACTPCFPGEFADDAGSVACKACPPGYAARRSGSALCDPCEPGTYSAYEGEFACLPCPRGHFQDQEGTTVCRECPLGHIAPHEGYKKCLPCGPGTFYESSSRSCVKCPPNTFTDQSAQLQCRPCDDSTAAEGHGNSRCERRTAAGFGRRRNGSSSEDRAQECQPGYFNNGSAVVCQPCPLGSFASAPRAIECKKCSPGSFSATIASTQCSLAPPGSFVGEEGAWRPSRCPPGHYSDVEGSSKCRQCAENSSSVFGGRALCEPLVEGEVLQAVSWPRVELSLVGLNISDLQSNASLREELLQVWRLTQTANGVSRVEPHILDVAIDGASPSSGRVIVHVVLESMPPPPRRSRRALPAGGELFSDLQNATNTITTAKDSATDWFNQLTGKSTQSDFTRIPHANVTGVVPSDAFKNALVRQLIHAPSPSLHAAASLLMVRLSPTPFTSTRGIPCPRGSFFTRDTVSGERRCVPCPAGTFSSTEGQLDACTLCPEHHFSATEGAEICDLCTWGYGALRGAASCDKCSFFSRGCGDFWNNVVITVVAGVAAAVTAWQRIRELWSGPRVRDAQQQSESAALLAAVRVFGRVP